MAEPILFAVWVMDSGWVVDSGRPKEAQVQLYLPGGASVPLRESTLAPPGEYN